MPRFEKKKSSHLVYCSTEHPPESWWLVQLLSLELASRPPNGFFCHVRVMDRRSCPQAADGGHETDPTRVKMCCRSNQMYARAVHLVERDTPPILSSCSCSLGSSSHSYLNFLTPARKAVIRLNCSPYLAIAKCHQRIICLANFMLFLNG
jgi:hypothetical protein